VVALNKSIPDLSWLIHLCGTSLEVFETDYRQAWEDTLAREKSGSGEVVMVNIFVGKDSMSVPVLFNKSDATENSDAETFKQLLMWYCWMQYKGGFGEVLLPRKLVRVDKVQVGIASIPGFAPSPISKERDIQICPTSTNNPVLGERIKTYDLGRDTSSKVVNFLKPDSLDQKQHHQTTDMLSNVDSEGLEFIRAWDRNKVSVIAVVPFAVSLLFAMIWIVVSMARYKVDAQVAVQTAFTVAAFIVTAGKLRSEV
jgi:hypothetical protein